jgi:hypothetical protein
VRTVQTEQQYEEVLRRSDDVRIYAVTQNISIEEAVQILKRRSIAIKDIFLRSGAAAYGHNKTEGVGVFPYVNSLGRLFYFFENDKIHIDTTIRRYMSNKEEYRFLSEKWVMVCSKKKQED